jgi:AraC-like DNA-binding protein
MPDSTTSAFGELNGFQAALQNEGNLSLYVTTHGQFLARLTTVGLYRLRLAAVEEHLPRIGLLAVSPDTVLISFPIGDRLPPTWGGIQPRIGEFMSFGPEHRVHVRSQGPCRWGAIWLPANDLAECFRDLTDQALTFPPFSQLWRPPLATGRRLLHLHAAAIRAAEVRPETIVNAEAAHGMEQQLIDVLVACLSAGSSQKKIQNTQRDQGIAVRFENLLESQSVLAPREKELATALGISVRLLRICCAEDLGMSPMRYIRLRAMHSVHNVLHGGAPGVMSVSRIAHCHGFRDLSRFAATYRSLFGELPSVTLRRDSCVQVGHRPPRRRAAASMKLVRNLDLDQ